MSYSEVQEEIAARLLAQGFLVQGGNPQGSMPAEVQGF